jgi:hypothetical protein
VTFIDLATPSSGGHPTKSPPKRVVSSVFQTLGHLPLVVHSNHYSPPTPITSKQPVLSVGLGENLESLKFP